MANVISCVTNPEEFAPGEEVQVTIRVSEPLTGMAGGYEYTPTDGIKVIDGTTAFQETPILQAFEDPRGVWTYKEDREYSGDMVTFTLECEDNEEHILPVKLIVTDTSNLRTELTGEVAICATLPAKQPSPWLTALIVGGAVIIVGIATWLAFRLFDKKRKNKRK